MTPTDRPTTEPRPDEDEPQTSDEWRDVLIEYAPSPMVDAFRRVIEAEAAQGAAPLTDNQREAIAQQALLVGAAPRAEGLDVERLRDLLWGHQLDLQYVGPGDIEEADEWEYLAARLSRPSDEREGESDDR